MSLVGCVGGLHDRAGASACHEHQPADQAGHRARRGSRGGRPPQYDPVDYRGRNVVERGFNRVRQWRGWATRYDKLAIVYRSAVLVHAVTIWTKTLSDTT
jgi:transposase